MSRVLSKRADRTCIPATARRDNTDFSLRTQSEIQAALCEEFARMEQEYLGLRPLDIDAHLIGDLLVIRLRGVLTAAEQQLVRSVPTENGRNLLKQSRTLLIETARPRLESIIHGVTGVRAVSLHYDISTVTGEEVVLFTLAGPPQFRESNRK
jgi:uncharacterized protein YbcI